jgi:hypothetical protein
LGFFERLHPLEMMRVAVTPEKTEGKEERVPSWLSFINDSGNKDPGSLMDDATVPMYLSN